MNIKPIKSEEDYDKALDKVDVLWGAKKGTTKGDELEVWITLIESYEKKEYPIDAPDPISAIQFYIEQNGIKRTDLNKYFGSRGLVSDVLNGKKNLTLKMIKALHNGLGIPYDLLIA